jgi:16S rRNA C967 or C1407 C5-methylase (RsmB/RsmF family)
MADLLHEKEGTQEPQNQLIDHLDANLSDQEETEVEDEVIETKTKKQNKHTNYLERKKQKQKAAQSSVSKKGLKKILQQYQAIDSQLRQFHRHYEAQFTPERWHQQLLPSLIQPTKYVAMINKYIEGKEFMENLLKIHQHQSVPFLCSYFDNVVIHRSDASSKILGDSVSAVPENISTQDSSVANVSVQEKESLEDLDADEKHSTKHWPTPGLTSSLDPITGLCCYYPLDAASLFPVLLLEVHPSHSILDMCSAPGGKALSILQKLNLLSPSSALHGGHLTCNDVSHDRKIRLQNVIRRYIPRDLAYPINVTNYDLTSSSVLKQNFAASSQKSEHVTYRQYDRILLDAPCSSERHLLQEFYADFPFLAGSSSVVTAASGEDELATKVFQKSSSVQLNQYELLQWSVGRSKANAERQFQLLMNAVKLVNFAPTGRIVYSTCSLNVIENDLLVEKVLQKVNREKKGYTLEVIPIETILPGLCLGEATRLGWHMVPDNSEGFGPIYMSVLQKRRVKG